MKGFLHSRMMVTFSVLDIKALERESTDREVGSDPTPASPILLSRPVQPSSIQPSGENRKVANPLLGTEYEGNHETLGAVGATPLPGWGPRDPYCAWLGTLQDMAANRCQWRSCCQFLSRLPEGMSGGVGTSEYCVKLSPFPVHLYSFLYNKAFK
ncbi:hypothetical protein T265_09189 [Opisthorchis viverrini]|uniref:Uncharacterized protein n=1 Tax=Opisthorchis viverrini TaxID=6198 RepID=A0A074Z6S9_OPIVI|nr:hypothetical protein T265_09189 [Opisthorchis viverrini]KER22783.1 hypothetical protein T265_09189 [Opisthorchis viverrini]